MRSALHPLASQVHADVRKDYAVHRLIQDFSYVSLRISFCFNSPLSTWPFAIVRRRHLSLPLVFYAPLSRQCNLRLFPPSALACSPPQVARYARYEPSAVPLEPRGPITDCLVSLTRSPLASPTHTVHTYSPAVVRLTTANPLPLLTPSRVLGFRNAS